MVEARRDLLEVVGHEHDRPRSAVTPRVLEVAHEQLARGAGRGWPSVRRASRRSGSGMSARAIDVRRRSPAERVANGWSTVGPRPIRPASSPARSPIGFVVHVPPRLERAVARGHDQGPGRQVGAHRRLDRRCRRCRSAGGARGHRRGRIARRARRPYRRSARATSRRPRAASSCPSRWRQDDPALAVGNVPVDAGRGSSAGAPDDHVVASR